MQIEDISITKPASLVKLTSNAWPGAGKIPKPVLERIGSTDWVKGGGKNLVDPNFVKAPKNIIKMAERHLSSLATPHPWLGISTIRSTLIPLVNRDLKIYKERFNEAVDEIVANYGQAKEAARPHLESIGIYNERDYPEDIRARYGFDWTFFQLNLPDASKIDPEVYEEEVKKFQELSAEMRQMTSNALKLQLSEMIDHVSERLSGKNANGKPKIFRDSMITNVTEYLKTITERNLYDDMSVADLANQARNIFEGLDPDELRKYVDTQDFVRSAVENLKASLDEQLVDVPRRAITVRMQEAA